MGETVTHVWECRDRVMQWQGRPLIMGILNVTPDSFSDGGKYVDPQLALDRALEMEAQGADIIDLGGESSRPSAELVSKEVELVRVLPVLKVLRDKLRIPISIDTWKADVAETCLEEGAEVINDISAGRWDPLLWSKVAQHQAGYILMHSGTTPSGRHEAISAPDPVGEVRDFLRRFLLRAEENGLSLLSIICDPGFGFAKTFGQNLLILRDLETFAELRRPIAVGLSRKSFLKETNGSSSVDFNTTIANVWAAGKGAAIWRVHDVAMASLAAKLVSVVQTPPEGA